MLLPTSIVRHSAKVKLAAAHYVCYVHTPNYLEKYAYVHVAGRYKYWVKNSDKSHKENVKPPNSEGKVKHTRVNPLNGGL